MKSKIESKFAPAAIGPYSQGTVAGSTAYISGMLGIDPATGELKEGIEAQAEQALLNLEAVLKEDPRPGYQDDPDRVYAFSVGGKDVRFSVRDGILTVYCAFFSR